MGQVIPFNRAARAHADLTPDQVLRRCRIAAICSGCNNAGRAAVELASLKMIAAGVAPHRVIESAKSIATQLAKPTTPAPA